MAELTPLPVPKPRLSKKLRQAIELRVRKGLTVAMACEAAGMSQSGYYKALGRLAVRDYLEEQSTQFIAETERLRAHAKAVAIETALDLMRNAKSETVRARMIEFLAGDGKAPQIAVNVDARTQGGGYEYPPQGGRVVEFEPAPADGKSNSGAKCTNTQN